MRFTSGAPLKERVLWRLPIRCSYRGIRTPRLPLLPSWEKGAAYRGRFLGKPLRAIFRFRHQDAQTPPSPLVGEGVERGGDLGRFQALGRVIDMHGYAVTYFGQGLRAQPQADPAAPLRQQPAQAPTCPRRSRLITRCAVPLQRRRSGAPVVGGARRKRPGGTPCCSASSIRVPTATVHRVTVATTSYCQATASGSVT